MLTLSPEGSNIGPRRPRTGRTTGPDGPGAGAADGPGNAVPDSGITPIAEPDRRSPGAEPAAPGPEISPAGRLSGSATWAARSRLGAGVLTAAAGVTYSSWVLEFVLPGGPNPSTSFLSELAEPDRPFAWVYSFGDTLTGVLAIAAGILGLLVFPRRRWPVVGWVALAAFGAATVADSRLPLHRCHPDPCPHVDYGLFPQLHQIHALTSTLAVFSIFLTMVAFAVAGMRAGRRADAGLWILGVGAVVTVWMLVADNLPGNYALGVAQRIQVACMSVWLVAAGVRICRAERLVSRAKSATTGMVGT